MKKRILSSFFKAILLLIYFSHDEQIISVFNVLTFLNIIDKSRRDGDHKKKK